MADGPHIAVERDDGYGVVAGVAYESAATDHALRRVGFQPLAEAGRYALTSPEHDATRRAQQAVQSLRSARFRVTAAPAYDPRPSAPVADRPESRPTTTRLQLEPDVAFGRDADLGVVATVADDRRFLDEVLRDHGFAHSGHFDLYLLPTGTPHNTAVRAVAGASRVLQDARLEVLADPRITMPPAVPAADRLLAREPAPAQSVAALTAEVHEARSSTDFADILDQLVDEHRGVVADLEEFVGTAAAWCDRLGTPSGRDLAGHLRATAVRVDDLRDHLTEAQLNFAVMPDRTPDNSPALTALPHTPQRDVRPPAHEARAQAALLASPHRPTTAPAPATAPSATAVTTAPRRAR